MITPEQLQDSLAKPVTDMMMANSSQNPLAQNPNAPVTSASPTPPGTPITTPVASAAASAGQHAMSDHDANQDEAPDYSGTFAGQLARAADKIGIPSKAPGGWARSLVSAAQSTLAGLSDVSSKPTTPGGSAIIEGIGDTLANRQNRIQQQAQQQQDAAAKQKAEARADQQSSDQHAKSIEDIKKDQLEEKQTSMAMENSLMVQSQKLSSITEDNWDRVQAQDSRALKMFKDAGAAELQEGITAQQAQALIQQNKLGPWSSHAFMDGQKAVGAPDPTTGVQKFQPTYTVLADIPDVTIKDQAEADFLKKNDPAHQEYKVGQVLPGASFGLLHQQAMNAEQATIALDHARTNMDLEKASDAQKERILQMNPDLSIAQSKTNNNLLQTAKYLQNMKTSSGQTKYPASDVIAALFNTDKDPTGHEGLQQAQDKQEQFNLEEEKNKLVKAGKGDEAMGDPQYIGDTAKYIASLPAARRQLVQDIGTGRLSLSQRIDYLASRNQGLLEDVANAFPNFDKDKAAEYGPTYKDFTSGKTSQSLKAGATALLHMKDLYEESNQLSRVPGTESAKTRTATFNQVASELARFNAGGNAPNQQEVDDAKKTLGGDGAWDRNRQAAIQQAATLIKQNLDGYQEKWKNAAPSNLYQAPIPWISKGSTDAANFLANGGKYVATDPDGGSHTFKDQSQLDAFNTQVAQIQAQQGKK